MRIGQGYDVHRLEEGRALVIGGVKIPYEKGLCGHSDADVLMHAVTDALLGAAHLKDIGAWFPDNDPRYEGIDSAVLLAKVAGAVREAGYEIVNVDSTVICQAPKLSPYREEMEENIALALSIPKENVNVKFKTEEKLGFTGEGKGIASQAVCLID
ncbi:MAG: 2-C-methyl-D-erythritol 2,4-cyclodiphosphate synthase [Lachnospiraceae bacterium]|nr:2-C-methyl-D-erythritol 2,4-cyclodiphosphate synthase [Lachnospiraceae bacterium]